MSLASRAGGTPRFRETSGPRTGKRKENDMFVPTLYHDNIFDDFDNFFGLMDMP